PAHDDVGGARVVERRAGIVGAGVGIRAGDAGERGVQRAAVGPRRRLARGVAMRPAAGDDVGETIQAAGGGVARGSQAGGRQRRRPGGARRRGERDDEDDEMPHPHGVPPLPPCRQVVERWSTVDAVVRGSRVSCPTKTAAGAQAARRRARITADSAVTAPPTASARGTPMRSPTVPAMTPPSVAKPKKITVSMLITRPRMPSCTCSWMMVVSDAIVIVWSAPRTKSRVAIEYGVRTRSKPS